MFQLEEATIAEISQAFESGLLTSEQLVQLYLDRIATYDQQGPALNAIITLNPEALETAIALDQERQQQGPRGPLHGIPVLLKDNIDTADLPTSAGAFVLEDLLPPDDAYVVQELRDAGAIILGKTNLDEFARNVQGVSALGGQTLNPYDFTRAPGGSSGGTAVAITANFAVLGLGTETGVSIRNPAANNSLVGIAPTAGLVSRDGTVPISFTLDRVGPIARTVEDAAIALDVIAGFDESDPITADSVGNIPAAGYTSLLSDQALEGARIGIFRDLFRTGNNHAESVAIIEQAIDDLVAEGAVIVDDVSLGIDLFSVLDDARVNLFETAFAVNNYLDSLGPNAPVQNLQDILNDGRLLPRTSLIFSLSQGLSEFENNPDYLERLSQREFLQDATVNLLESLNLDALVYPMKTLPAPLLGELSPESDNPFTSITGLPGIVVPAGVTSAGLPIGLEFSGEPFDEALLLSFAYDYEQATQHRIAPASVPFSSPTTETMQVSLSTSTTFDGDLNALVETQGTAITFRFDLDEPAPAGGVTLFVDADVEQMLNRLDLPAFAFNPVTENIDFGSIFPNRDSSGFVATIDEGATFGTATLNIFNNSEPETFLPATFDGLVEATFSLLTEEQVDRDVEGPLPTLSDYTIDAATATSVVLFADDASQLPGTPPPSGPTMPQVSLFTGPNYLIEDEGTVSAHAFNVTGGVIPEDGLIVSVDAPNLGEFDLAGSSVEGGEIVAVREGGFELRMTEYTTLVNLPVADDGEAETGETASFNLAAGDGYEIVTDYSGGSFNLVDTRLDIPRGVINEPNNAIASATETQLSSENPTFFGTDAVYFDIGNRYLNEDGTYTYIDYSEDVDVYKVDLTAGETITIETFDFDTNVDEFGVGFAINALVYDAEGNQLQDYLNTGFDPAAAPDKLFGGIGPFDVNETDSYDEFTAPADGAYFIAVGDDGQVQNFWDEVAPFYNPNDPGSGNGNRAIFGDYSIEINLITDDNPRKTGTPTPPVSNPGVTNPPTLSLSANPTTTDGDGNFTSAVVEHVDVGGISSTTFTIQAEGELPEGGLEFVLNSDTNLFDYVSYLGQSALPSTIGGQSLGAYYNAEGIPTGIRLLIDEPLMTVTYETANNQPWFPDFYGNIVDRYEPLETDGPEDVNFFLQPGEGYTVSAEAGSTDVTYYDSVADVPPPTVGGDTVPTVGITTSESTLIETEQTETTITLNLSEAPPPEGLTLFVDSEDDTTVGSPLSQFAVLEAEVTGGNFPIPNADSSGFFFTVTEQTASITLSVFDELTVPNIDPLTVQEGVVGLNFALQPLAGYTIDPEASDIKFTIADNLDSGIQVSLTGEPEALIESEGTISVHTFSLSTPPPAEGLTVSVNASALSEFDLDAIDVAGGTIAAVRDDGFDLTITEQTTTISLPVLDDGVAEGSETASFALAASDNYELNAAFNEATFTLADTLDQATVSEESELTGDEISNSTIPEANALSLSVDNPSVSISGLIGESFSDLPEDVDFFSFNLEAGQTVGLDIDTEEILPNTINFRQVVYPALAEILQKPDTELRLFDADGNELATNRDGAAPGEDFSRDPYLEFTAEAAGTYYVGVSQLGNRNYDPFVSRTGSGWTFPEVGINNGFYDLTATLTEGDIQPPDNTATPGDDTLVGTDSIDTIAGELGNDIITGGAGGDILRGDLNSRSPQDDTAGGNDIIFGGEGNDRIGGKAGNDILSGDAGDDFIWGDDGDDIIMGVTGNDTLVGDNFSDGSGSDLFVFGNGDGTDTILDFEVGTDRIGLVDGELAFEDLTMTQDGRNATLSVTGSSEVIAILQNVQASALTGDSFEVVADVSNPEEALAII
ncbi:MAG: amidase family protein [Cyanobacteria bacterium J06634_5]